MRTPFDQVTHRVSIGGAAIDVNTGEAIGGVQLVARGPAGTRAARSDARGLFWIEDLPRGTYTITVLTSDWTAHGPEKEVTTIELPTSRTGRSPAWIEVRVEAAASTGSKGE